MSTPVYQQIASTLGAYYNCVESDNKEWEIKHRDRLKRLVKSFLPSGSGFDSGTDLLIDESNKDKLVFEAGYHHMSEHGYYTHWSHVTVTVTASLAYDFEIEIKMDAGEEEGEEDRRMFREFVAEEFSHALSVEIDREDKRVA